MRVKDLPTTDRPRERLLRNGVSALSDQELLAIVLGSGNKGVNAVELAAQLIAHCGDLGKVIRSEAHRLQTVPGMGPAKATRVAAAFDLVRRAQAAPEPTRITCSGDLAKVAAPPLRGMPTERLVVVACDPRGAVIRRCLVSQGGNDHTPAPIRDIITAVLHCGGTCFGVAHNHPSGSLEPSASDRDVTQCIAEAADTVGLHFLDHLIITDHAWRRIALESM